MSDEGLSRRSLIKATIATGVARGLTYSSSVQGMGSTPDPSNADQCIGAPYLQTKVALDKLRDPGASIRDTGAKGDFLTDDTAALQEMSDHFGKVGGSWHLPAGVYRTTAPIKIRCEQPQAISGQGQRGVYPGPFDVKKAGGLAVIVPVHNGRQAFQFVGAKNGDGSVVFRNLAISALRNAAAPQSCFGWDTTDGIFLRNFSFLFISINGFRSAFDVFQSTGPMKQVGVFKALFCNIHHNEWIARTSNGTQWNGFEFSHNEAGQNGYLPQQGGIDISAHAVSIVGNSLEGMRDPVRVSGLYRGIDIRSNYFESNVGKALIQLAGVRGPFHIGPQAHVAVDFGRLEHPVLLSHCGPGVCELPYRGDGVHKTPIAVSGADENTADLVNNSSAGTSDDGWLRCDAPHCSFIGRPDNIGLSLGALDRNIREISPFDGASMVVQEYSTSSQEYVETVHGLQGSAGLWAVFSCLMKRLQDGGPAADPSLSLRPSNGLGRDYRLYSFDNWWRSNEWCLITAAIKLTAPLQTLTATFRPFGLSLVKGRKARLLQPAVYLTDHPDKITPYVDVLAARSLPAAPRQGQWNRGDFLYNSAPSGSGQARFLCIEGGEPGVWVYS